MFDVDRFAADAKILRDRFYPSLIYLAPQKAAECHDGDALANFKSVLNRESSPQATLIAEMLAELFSTGLIKMNPARVRGTELGLTTEDWRRLVLAVNEQFMYPVSRELTGHGVQRTFRFWSNEEKADYLQYCSSAADFLASKFENVCVGFGAVLSMIRDNQMMPHDDDVDVVVAFDIKETPTYPEALRKVSETLASGGYITSGEHPAHFWVREPGKRSFDVFVALIEENAVSSFPAPRRGIPLASIFPAIRGSLHGVELLVPRNPWQYLEAVYGPDWMVPAPMWYHRGKMPDYLDILPKSKVVAA